MTTSWIWAAICILALICAVGFVYSLYAIAAISDPRMGEMMQKKDKEKP